MNRDYVIECYNRLAGEIELVNIERAHGKEAAIARFTALGQKYSGVSVRVLLDAHQRSLIDWTGDVPEGVRTETREGSLPTAKEPLAGLAPALQSDEEAYSLADGIEHERDA